MLPYKTEAQGWSIPKKQRDGLIETLEHLTEDKLILILRTSNEKHQVSDKFVHNDDIVEHRDLSCITGGGVTDNQDRRVIKQILHLNTRHGMSK